MDSPDHGGLYRRSVERIVCKHCAGRGALTTSIARIYPAEGYVRLTHMMKCGKCDGTGVGGMEITK